MFNVNKVILGARITSELELKYTSSGMAVLELTLATNKKNKNGEKEASFFRVKIFGKTAEVVNQYCRKGSALLVEGELKQETWEKDGQKQYRIVVLASSVSLESGNQTQNQVQSQAPQQTQQKQVQSVASIEISDDEIPF